MKLSIDGSVHSKPQPHGVRNLIKETTLELLPELLPEE